MIEEPSKLLESEYISCPSQPLEIKTIDPSSSSFSFYKFEWTNNASGAVVSTSNTLITSDKGNFTVRYFLENSSGETTCDFTQSRQITNISTMILSLPAQECVWTAKLLLKPILNYLEIGLSKKSVTPLPKSHLAREHF